MSDPIQETLEHANEAAQKLNKLMDDCVAAARDTIEAGDENLPTWLLEDASGAVSVHLTPWASDLEKTLISIFIRQQIERTQAVRMVFVSEVWMVKAKRGEEIHCQPSQHPNRKEVLLVNGEDKTGEKVFRHYEILRPQNKLGPEMKRDYATSTGRFTNMFEQSIGVNNGC